ncbi:MAG: alpha/beta hydrolase [Asticcacaulis sp.]
MKIRYLAAAFLLAIMPGLASLPAHAQVATIVPPPVAGAAPVFVEKIKVHSPSLEGNLEGEPADRDVVVYLPPDYKTNPKKRYPVVYALHGYWLTAEKWTSEIHTPQTIEGAFATGTKGMIVVLPNSWTIYNGSMYSNSATTGNFEGFIAHDLVSYIDSHYRTIANRDSRGLAGHSMGGYGASRIGMKYPEVFGALYIMSPCCMSARGAPPADAGKQLEAVKTAEDAAKIDGFARSSFAVAAAWSPNPKNPPLYFDLPTKDGVPQPEVVAKWAANAPLAMVDQYISNLRQYHAIAMDVGDQDGLRFDTQKLHEILEGYGIANSFEQYSGTHTSAVADRFQNHVLPFFGKTLSFDQGKTKP